MESGIGVKVISLTMVGGSWVVTLKGRCEGGILVTEISLYPMRKNVVNCGRFRKGKKKNKHDIVT
jgi:hypothetical protein